MFHGHLDLRSVPPNKWKTLQTLLYTSDLCTVSVPKDFITDLASIPRALRWLISINGKHRKAAVLHDYLYSRAGSTGIDRAECDLIFKEAMTYLGVSWWKTNAMYAGVRAGGWIAWRKHLKMVQQNNL